MALHVHYKTFYVSQPLSAKQQRQICHVSITDNIVKGGAGDVLYKILRIAKMVSVPRLSAKIVVSEF